MAGHAMLGRAAAGTRISTGKKEEPWSPKASVESLTMDKPLGAHVPQDTTERSMPGGGNEESALNQKISTDGSTHVEAASRAEDEADRSGPANSDTRSNPSSAGTIGAVTDPGTAQRDDGIESDGENEAIDASAVDAGSSDGGSAGSARALKRRLGSREPVRYWTEEEHRLFLAGVQKFGGRNYKALAEHIKTRTPTQVRTHLQKYLVKLQKVKRLKAEAENIKQQLGIGVSPEILSAVGVGSMPVTADPVLSAAAGLKDLASPPQALCVAKSEKAVDGAKEEDAIVDELSLVEVFEEMANESRTNEGNQGMNKNCHFCGHEPKRFGTVACCVPTCGQRFCEHCLMKHMSHLEKAGALQEKEWTCPICRRVCCCVHETCTTAHRHCKRYRRARCRQHAGDGEQTEAVDSPSQLKTSLKPKPPTKKTKVDNADVCLLLEFCQSGA